MACSVLITCRVYQGTPGVTVWSCLCLYMLVTAATWPSQLCGCGLLAPVQDFMPPTWNMQVSESCFFWYSVFIVLYMYVFVLFCCPSRRYFSYAASPCEPCVMTRCFNTPQNVCVWLWSCESADILCVFVIYICCFVFLVHVDTLKRWAPEYKWLHAMLVQCIQLYVYRIWA